MIIFLTLLFNSQSVTKNMVLCFSFNIVLWIKLAYIFGKRVSAFHYPCT